MSNKPRKTRSKSYSQDRDRPSTQSSSPAMSPNSGLWPVRLGKAAAFLVVVGLIAVVFFSTPPLRGIPIGTETQAIGISQHVETPLDVLVGDVPAGGPHSSTWQNCGFYDSPIRAENALHSLEHGAVWITYDPALPQDEVSALRGFVRRPDKVLLTPVPGQDSPILVTAWANQLAVDTSQDTRLSQFVNEFEGAGDAPEPGGACYRGTGNPVG